MEVFIVFKALLASGSPFTATYRVFRYHRELSLIDVHGKTLRWRVTCRHFMMECCSVQHLWESDQRKIGQRSWTVVPLQKWPQLIAEGAVELGWSFRVVLNWGKGDGPLNLSLISYWMWAALGLGCDVGWDKSLGSLGQFLERDSAISCQ